MEPSSFIGHSARRIILALLFFLPANAFAVIQLQPDIWSYHQEWDKLTNQSYSYARSPLPRRELYDNLRLEIGCKENKLFFIIDANSLITSPGRTFDVDYQIDKKQPVTIQMKTFADTKRKGYAEEQARSVAEDILTGQSMFVRVHTMIQRVLTGAFPLDDAAEPIKKVFADCGIAVSNALEVQSGYNLTDFSRDFNRLSAEQQRQALDKIRSIMLDMLGQQQ
ncbi:MAG: hypothetical protein ACU837_04375 [Gammaproteobacteria bacterium]